MSNILYENVVSVGRARPTISPHAPPGGWEVHGAKFNIHLTVPLQKQSQLRQKLQWNTFEIKYYVNRKKRICFSAYAEKMERKG